MLKIDSKFFHLDLKFEVMQKSIKVRVYRSDLNLYCLICFCRKFDLMMLQNIFQLMPKICEKIKENINLLAPEAFFLFQTLAVHHIAPRD
jgi:hypothetical protein